MFLQYRSNFEVMFFWLPWSVTSIDRSDLWIRLLIVFIDECVSVSYNFYDNRNIICHGNICSKTEQRILFMYFKTCNLKHFQVGEKFLRLEKSRKSS